MWIILLALATGAAGAFLALRDSGTNGGSGIVAIAGKRLLSVPELLSDRIILWSDPAMDIKRGSYPMAVVRTGAFCEVLESVTVAGTKLWRVRAKGAPISDERIMQAVFMCSTSSRLGAHMDDHMRQWLSAQLQEHGSVEGWTARVSD